MDPEDGADIPISSEDDSIFFDLMGSPQPANHHQPPPSTHFGLLNGYMSLKDFMSMQSEARLMSHFGSSLQSECDSDQPFCTTKIDVDDYLSEIIPASSVRSEFHADDNHKMSIKCSSNSGKNFDLTEVSPTSPLVTETVNASHEKQSELPNNSEQSTNSSMNLSRSCSSHPNHAAPILEDSLINILFDPQLTGHFTPSTQKGLPHPTSFLADDFLAETNCTSLSQSEAEGNPNCVKGSSNSGESADFNGDSPLDSFIPEIKNAREDQAEVSKYSSQSTNSSMNLSSYKEPGIHNTNVTTSSDGSMATPSIIDFYNVPQDLGRPSEDIDSIKEPIQEKPGVATSNTLFIFCACKLSRCVQRHCKCFDGSFYCGKACSCEDCFNTEEYEDFVQKAKGRIKSANEEAFYPKVVAVRETISSDTIKFRHRTGCNCKKSFCQKKYCECFQAEVGCSDMCRCEGCKNDYGRNSL